MKDARNAINELAQEIIKQPISDSVRSEAWRIMKIANDAESDLNDIHDKALDLRREVLSEDAKRLFEEIMACARYKLDVRPSPE